MGSLLELRGCFLLLALSQLALLAGWSVPGQAASLEKARDLFLAGSFEDALKETNEIIEKTNGEDERGLAHFMAGTIYIHTQRYDEARVSFEKNLAAKSGLGAYAFYELGQAYFKLNRYKDARLALERVGYFRPPNELKYQARFLMAEVALAEKKYPEALKHFNYLSRRWKRAPEYPEILFRQIQVHLATSTRPQHCSMARKLYTQYPTHPRTREWGFDLHNVEIDGTRLGCIATPQNQSSRLRRLQLAGETDKARKEMDQLRSSGRSRDLYRADILLANHLTNEGYADEALQILVKYYTNSSRDVNYLLALAKAASRAGEFQTAIGAYLKVNILAGRRRSGREALFQAAFMSYQFQDYDGASRRFDLFVKKYPRSGLARDALWHLAWVRYLRGDYSSALAQFSNLQHQRYRTRRGYRTRKDDRVIYWQAMSHLRMDQAGEARKLFEKLSAESPYSYYGLAARARLETLPKSNEFPVRQLAQDAPPEAESELEPDSEQEQESEAKLSEDGEEVSEVEMAGEILDSDEDEKIQVSDFKDPRLRRRFETANELIQVGQMNWARHELYEVEKRSRNSTYLRNLIKAYENINSYHRAVSIAENIFTNERNRLGLSGAKDLWQTAFPKAFPTYVNRFSREFHLPTEIALSIMKAESQFRPEVISPVGAKGLMQIMPETGRQVARLLGDEGEFQEGSLLIPEVNIRLGMKYLARLSSKFKSSLGLVAAGYNAGPHRVEGWLHNFGYLEMDEFIEHIPFVETRNYVKKVSRNYSIYKELYDGDSNALSWLTATVPVKIDGRPAQREIWEIN